GPAPSTSMSHSMSTPPAYDAAEGAATGAAGALAGVGAGAAAATPVDNVRISAPSATLSPTLTFSSAIVPPTGDGTSIVALSDSSVINGSSGFTVSPLFTCTSMTGTSLKSPMSGTSTLTSVAMMSVLDQHAPHVGEQVREVAVEARGGRAVDDAVVPRQRQRQHEAPRRRLAV